jgi:hypothetical protein
MSPSRMSSKLVWFFPFLVSGLMAFGALIGMSIFSDAVRQEGPAGDLAGAAGALIAIICVVTGFIMTTLTLIVNKLLRRDPPDQIAFRLGLSIVGGVIIGALGSTPGKVPTIIAWLLLLILPVLLVWLRSKKVVTDKENKIE